MAGTATADPPLTESDRQAIEDVNATPDSDDLGEQGGKSIEDLAEGHMEDEEGQALLDFGDQINLKIAGKKPRESKIKIRAIKRDIQGQLGDRSDDEDYGFFVVGRLQNVQTPYDRDESGRCVGKQRVHTLDPRQVTKVPEALMEPLTLLLERDFDAALERIAEVKAAWESQQVAEGRSA
jgi:hypothetical protein